MNVNEFLDNLIAKGYSCFTSIQAKEALGVSEIATRAALRRLKQKKILAQPLKGFYVIVPPEYRILGCRPAEHFIHEMMEYVKAPYYIGLLSAAQYYGAAHHRPQQYQVITSQKRRPITCDRVKIVFITKKNIDGVPTQKITTPQSIITVSTPEVTAMDLVIYANRCGGMDNVLTVLTDLVDKLDSKKLAQLASKTKEITWVQRLGYLLDSIKANNLSELLEKKIKQRHRSHIRVLVPQSVAKNILHLDTKKLASISKKMKIKLHQNKKWKLIINKKIEPEET
jgi:predicted transcriptional regulator of viral defense system